jgi:hypothetical protein
MLTTIHVTYEHRVYPELKQAHGTLLQDPLIRSSACHGNTHNWNLEVSLTLFLPLSCGRWGLE